MILAYHNIALRSEDYNTVDIKHFKSQIESLKGKEFVYLSEYNPSNENQVVISFDDAYRSLLEYALPILKKYNLPFEVFIVEDFVREAEKGSEIFLNIKELNILIENGGRLQYHSRKHLDLTLINNVYKLKKEIVCPAYLKRLDKKGFEYFAYPFWLFNDKVINIVKEHYKGAVTGRAYGDDTSYQLHRTRINNYKREIPATAPRIAIQLFGHLRTFKDTYEALYKNVINIAVNEGYDVDIFIHTWNSFDHNDLSHKCGDNPEREKKTLSTSDRDLINSIYKPKVIKSEQQLDCEDVQFKLRCNGILRSTRTCYNMSYTIYQSSEIRKQYEKENNIKYEWVLVTRPDILFKSTFSIEKFLKAYEDCYIPVPLYGDEIFSPYLPFGRGNEAESPYFATYTDLAYFGRPSTINKACSLFENFKIEMDLDNYHCGEVWIMLYWIKQGLKPVYLKYYGFTDFEIKRETISQNKKLFTRKLFLRKLSLQSRKFVLSLLPYFLVKSSINRIKQKLSTISNKV